MRNALKVVAGLAVAGLASVASADVYTDSTGENFDGNAHMDISSVEVTNTATDITFKITLSGDVVATNWGKYLVGIDTNAGTGDTGSPVGNPWGRNIRIADGMDAFIGSWVDTGGGAQAWTYAGGAWTQNGAAAPATITQFSTTFTVPLASLGLTAGQPFRFDVYSSGGGGGDSANDAAGLSTQTVNNWQVPYDSGQNLLSYPVPEPTTLSLVGLAGAGLLARRRKA